MLLTYYLIAKSYAITSKDDNFQRFRRRPLSVLIIFFWRVLYVYNVLLFSFSFQRNNFFELFMLSR